jgi:hypothetical protein
MATFKVTDPSTGKVLRLTGDSPPSEQELEQIFAAQAQPQAVAQPQVLAPQPVAPQAPIQPQVAPAQAAPQVQPTFAQALTGQVGGISPEEAQAQGFDVEGAKERERVLASMSPERRALLESITPVEAGFIGAGRGLTTIGRAVGLAEPETPSQRQRFEELEKVRPIATTVGEVAGEAAPFIAPGLGVAGLGARAAQVAGTAALGATEAGLIARGKGADIGQQLFSAGIGGTVAGALDLALPVIGRIGSKAVRRILGKAPDGAVIDAAGNPSDELLDALSETGQTFDDVIKEAQDELSKQAVDPKEASRKAFLRSQGIDPTRAQITRNAADFQTQQEAAKTAGKARDALERQEAMLTTRFNDAILETGGSATRPTSTVADSLTEKATKLDQEISDLYTAARSAIPEDKNIKFDGLTATLRKLAPADRRAGGNISTIVGDMQGKGILDKNMKVVGRVDVATAEDLRKLANELYDEKNTFANGLLRQIKDKLDDDVFKTAGNDFFKEARKSKANFEKELSRAKISKFDSRRDNLVRDILENKIDPDQMVDKVVFGKRWRPDDLQQLKSYITTDEAGKSAFDDLRAEVMNEIKDRSFIGTEDAAGFQALSRDKLQKAISNIGDKKLNILFDGKERKFLNDMLQVAKLREPVRGTALGRGPSAQAISRLQDMISTNPLFKSILETVTFDAQGRAVLKAKPTPIRQPLALPAGRGAAIAPAVAVAQPEEQQQ